MVRFLLAAIWGLVVLFSLIGWGSLLARLLRPKHPLPLGMSAAIGIGFAIILGGLLGLFHSITAAILIGFLMLGLPLLLLRKRSAVSFRCDGFISAFIILLVACRYLSAVHQTDFEPQDDVPAYLVYPLKMLQTGQFAPDPYSDRRMNGIGGQPLTQSLVIAPLDVSSINLFDHGIAFLVLLLITFEWLISIDASRGAISLVLLTLSLTYPNYVNTASFITISALLLAIFVLLNNPIDSIRDTLLLAILVAGICSLKTTVFPLVGCILVLHFCLAAIRSRSGRPLGFAFITALLVFIFLFPWMIAMQQSSGSFLPPLLGRGNSMLPSLAGTAPHGVLIAQLLIFIACVAAAVLILLCLRKSPHQNWAGTAALFPLATAPVVFLISYMTGGVGWMRYAQPFVLGWIALPITAAWIWANDGNNPRRWLGKSIGFCIAFAAIGQSFGWARPHYFHGNPAAEWLCGPPLVIARQCTAISNSFDWKPLRTTAEIAAMKQLQAAIPPGATVLERLDFPQLLDFKRNAIFITDHPGLAYPSPGLPESPTPKELGQFLLDHNVRYIAYSYGDEAGFSHTDAATERSQYAWLRIVIHRTLAFQDAVAELMKSHGTIYDDGHSAVIDLQKH